MKTVGEILKLSAQFLQERTIERSRFQAELLLSYFLKIQRLDLYLQIDRPLEEEELRPYREALKRLGRKEPLEYILGEMDFFSCSLQITPAVLIPRKETEIFLHKIWENLKHLPKNPLETWDICCGSGCLGIGLKKALPHLTVTLTDISCESLEVAKENARRNLVEVSFLQGDLLQPLQGRKADCVLCNPPYVSEKEYADLDKGVRGFEPRIALVGGEMGSEFYKRLSEELPFYLNKGAKIFFEIGYNQGKEIQCLFSSRYWKNQRLEKDWAGHDRFFFLEFE